MAEHYVHAVRVRQEGLSLLLSLQSNGVAFTELPPFVIRRLFPEMNIWITPATNKLLDAYIPPDVRVQRQKLWFVKIFGTDIKVSVKRKVGREWFDVVVEVWENSLDQRPLG